MIKLIIPVLSLLLAVLSGSVLASDVRCSALSSDSGYAEGGCTDGTSFITRGNTTTISLGTRYPAMPSKTYTSRTIDGQTPLFIMGMLKWEGVSEVRVTGGKTLIVNAPITHTMLNSLAKMPDLAIKGTLENIRKQ